MLIPTALDDIVRDSRAGIERMRRQFGDQEDFDHLIRRALAELLTDIGYDRKTVEFTMRAMFGH